ncbi:3',5'-cyclic-nucleotide phosphodiesterase [Ectothiorhodospira lacustris]|uniref:3',5'-cyclic-nucleotide phosphodiesterase n=1 Tax=Ectothiorhodospira lacustris TaxID=2899127 RepID=UPI001EE8320B|nr:3',5'-cyclic-nucleotide phosphodiesterase [Ectothiorhodospira lacustris]MCG5499408.1 3',5'-cyclic-nucleotide phosphodiesterase [Ectothiorhodospira lacustris]MCG5511287.1 3',5'-cyclic-nucleotide phosphodiesterase [Ectothiorhodospira lacustris]MCG5523015.1 3',5'-cyclic-nucleotide phosphodiesterase [Ectothiorhodospira lacustris]
MQITVLGCSGGIGDGRRTTSIMIDDDILIDCGTGVGDLSLEAMARIRHLLITHTHLDHIACLPLLVDTLFSRLQSRPLVIHARADCMHIIHDHIFNWQIWPDFFELPERERPVVQFDAMVPDIPLHLDGRRIDMLPVAHSVPAVGYRVERDGVAFAFSGDTTSNDVFWDALNAHDALDLLFVECAFPDRDQALGQRAGHYCPSLLAKDLAKLRHAPRVGITHLKPGEEDGVFEALEAQVTGRDLLRLCSGDIFTI